MYAIVVTGGKQYKVSQDDIIRVEKLDANIGDQIKLDVMMLVDDTKVVNGNPLVKDAEVLAEVVEQGKEDKVVVFKYKAFGCEVIEVLDIGVDYKLGSRMHFTFYNFFHDGHVSVVNMSIGNNVHKFADLDARRNCKHMHFINFYTKYNYDRNSI